MENAILRMAARRPVRTRGGDGGRLDQRRGNGMVAEVRSCRLHMRRCAAGQFRCRANSLAALVARPARLRHRLVFRAFQIGRASCRARVCPYGLTLVVACLLKTKKTSRVISI